MCNTEAIAHGRHSFGTSASHGDVAVIGFWLVVLSQGDEVCEIFFGSGDC